MAFGDPEICSVFVFLCSSVCFLKCLGAGMLQCSKEKVILRATLWITVRGGP